MDVISTVIKVWLPILYWLVPALVIAGIIKSAWFKGVLGEFQINIITKLFLDKEVYHLIKNVTLPTDDGTTQIDHIIVSTFGIFVVETKNMKGWIYGGKHQKKWTQNIFGNKRGFQNPLHQNYKHTKTLESALELQPEQIHPVVVFIGDATFKTSMPDNVLQGYQYIKYIKSFNETVLSADEVHSICEQIKEGRLNPSLKTHINHVKHVQQIVSDKQRPTEKKDVEKDDDPICCPKCGSPMVKRKAKKGANAGKEFWGCSAFPRCKKILQIG